MFFVFFSVLAITHPAIFFVGSNATRQQFLVELQNGQQKDQSSILLVHLLVLLCICKAVLLLLGWSQFPKHRIPSFCSSARYPSIG